MKRLDLGHVGCPEWSHRNSSHACPEQAQCCPYFYPPPGACPILPCGDFRVIPCTYTIYKRICLRALPSPVHHGSPSPHSLCHPSYPSQELCPVCRRRVALESYVSLLLPVAIPHLSPVIGRDLEYFSQAGFEMDRIQIKRNAPVSLLYEDAIRNEGAIISSSGALINFSGKKTGRSPKDKRIVYEETSKDDIWWGSVNIKMDERKSPSSIDATTVWSSFRHIRNQSWACHRLS